jgi:hypothetical protein
MAHVADPELAEALSRAGVVFEQDEDGDAKIEVDVGDGRTQVVSVRSKLTGWPDYPTRQIYSCAYIGREDLPRRVMDSLLAQNADLNCGGWGTIQDGGDLMLLFEVHLSVSAPPLVLRSAIGHVAKVADDREAELSTGDSF